jgi:glycosyltransferase involved in cell wall biosynthesis
MPKVTVLMPVYNAEAFLNASLESILKQGFSDFEFLIIDDGSSDRSLSIIKSYDDKRIRIIKNEHNLGLVRSLNIGLAEAKGEYISRMDADDVAHSKRLLRIVDHFENNPKTIICSTWHNTSVSSRTYQKYPLNPDEIKSLLLFRCPVSAASYRSEYFRKNKITYSEDFPHAEDYELWTRLMFHVDFAIIPECLLKLTIHENQVSHKFLDLQKQSSRKLQEKLLHSFGIDFTEEELEIHTIIAGQTYENNSAFIAAAEKWFKKLIEQNDTNGIIDKIYFKKTISKIWFEMLTHISSKKIKTIHYFRNSPLSDKSEIPFFLYLKFLLKNFLSKSPLLKNSDA